MHPITLLAAEANARGDLFTKLIGSVLHTLGYSRARFNVHKAGREIDILADHRTEDRAAIAECKATARPIGGDDLNKFLGVLVRESMAHAPRPLVGYFVSLAGFTESAHEQERERAAHSDQPHRIVLLAGADIIRQLVDAGDLVAPDNAVGQALALQAATDDRTATDGKASTSHRVELLAHQLGWFWCVSLLTGNREHAWLLVHADGAQVSRPLADEVTSALPAFRERVANLRYLGNVADGAVEAPVVQAARREYLSAVMEEYGTIRLDGLPADREIGSRAFPLDDLFVPLRLVVSPPKQTSDAVVPEDALIASSKGSGALGSLKAAIRRTLFRRMAEEVEAGDWWWEPPFGTHGSVDKQTENLSLDAAIGRFSYLVALAPPGSGKTTLIKRLACAAAAAAKDKDDSPRGTSMPFVIRCRELGEIDHNVVWKLLVRVCTSMAPGVTADVAEQLVGSALHCGNALVLVDGLDEVAATTRRTALAHGLRRFQALYPAIKILITSREPGFRTVAGALGPFCTLTTVAELDDDDIREFVRRWFQSVYQTESARQEALKLAEEICRLDRVRELAGNPLLLTTLLLVQRWLRQLPNKRSILYQKAIEVLLMTWNVEAWEPLDPDEIVPQLAYVAFTMMKAGTQRLSHGALRKALTNARREMPEVLGQARMSVADLIQSIELRSSLLVEVGEEEEAGTLQAVYEFRHLTFQEYLAAVAVTQQYAPGCKPEDTPASIVADYIHDHSWLEVVPLAAILAGRRDVEGIVSSLVEAAEARFLGRDTSEPDASSTLEFSVRGSWPSPRRSRQRARSRLEGAPLPAPTGASRACALMLARCLLDEVRINDHVRERALGVLVRLVPTEPELKEVWREVDSGRFAAHLRKHIEALLETDRSTVGYRLLNALGRAHVGELCVRRQDPAAVCEEIAILCGAPDVAKTIGGVCAAAAAWERFDRLAGEGPWKSILGRAFDAVAERDISQDELLAQAFLFLPARCPGIIHSSKRTPRQILDSILVAWPRAPHYRDTIARVILDLEIPVSAFVAAQSSDPTTRDFLKTLGDSLPPRRTAQAVLFCGHMLGAPWDADDLRRRLAQLRVLDDRKNEPAGFAAVCAAHDVEQWLATETLSNASRKPVMALRDLVIFPHTVIPLFIGRFKSLYAVKSALERDRRLLMVPQLDPQTDNPGLGDLAGIAVEVTILQNLSLPDGTMKVLVEGVRRGRAEFVDGSWMLAASSFWAFDDDSSPLPDTAITEELLGLLRERGEAHGMPEEVVGGILAVEDVRRQLFITAARAPLHTKLYAIGLESLEAIARTLVAWLRSPPPARAVQSEEGAPPDR